MKYCHNCGAPLVDDVRFCTACGSPLDPPETEPAMPESAVMPEMPESAPEMPVMPGEVLPPEPPKKRKKRIWLWILLPVVVLALAAGALYYFLVWNAPEARVQRAWQKTAAALETEVGRPEKLMAFAETLRGPLSEQRALTASLTFESDGETLAAELYSQRDNAARRLGVAGVQVGVILLGKTAVCLLDLLRVRVVRNTEDLIRIAGHACHPFR